MQTAPILPEVLHHVAREPSVLGLEFELVCCALEVFVTRNLHCRLGGASGLC